jgi:REP element-mobilizing transposase RayT
MENNARKPQDSDTTTLQKDRDAIFSRESKPTHSDEKSAASASQPVEHVVLEYVEPNPYDLTYSCLLIPRFPSHFLIGDIVDELPVQLKQICVSFSWKLEFHSIKADHLQWTLRVPPSAAVGSFMKTIRDQTSKYILENFPRFKIENRSNDFWAPGYLVILSSQPHPVEMIRRFIRFTRQQQGIAPND